MNKQLITPIILSVLIAGLVGFYGGRIYERNAFRKNMGQRMQGFRNGTGYGNFRTGQKFPYGSPQGQAPAPTAETTPTPEVQK